jgi:hypothetical protein
MKFQDKVAFRVLDRRRVNRLTLFSTTVARTER